MRDPKCYNNPWVKADRDALFVHCGIKYEQRDRCEHMNAIGGCTINEDCNQRTAEERERKLCHVPVVVKRKRK